MNAGRITIPLAVAAICGAPLLAEAAVAADRYAAIAYSQANGYSGYANKYPTRAQAEERALQECGESCKVVLWVRNQCAVVIAGKDYGYGSAYGPDSDATVELAMAECEKRTSDCEQVIMTCSAY